MIGVCTDSSAQLPLDLAARLRIEVVPLLVTVDGVDRLDGSDLTADEFWRHHASGPRPDIVMCEPDPGQFAAAYEDLLARGCREIVSVHVSGAVAGALKAARLAAHSTPAPIRVVDTAGAGFGVGCAAWAAADAAAAGASLDEVCAAAERTAASLGHVVLLPNHHPDAVTSFELLCLSGGNATHLAGHTTAVDALNDMAARAVAWGTALRIGIGHSDDASLPLADALEEWVEAAASVVEVVRFRIGPSMGVLTGPGAIGCVMCPVG